MFISRHRFYLSPAMVDLLTLHQEHLLGGMGLIHPLITTTMATTVEGLVTNMIELMVNVAFAAIHFLMNQKLTKHLAVYMLLEQLSIATLQDK